MDDQRMYSAEQVATVARELREAAGTEDERFPVQQVLSMLSEEVRLLRERGFTDERIAALFGGFDIAVSADDLGRSSRL